jgi:hypothetical protein
METKTTFQERYENAKKRVDKIKAFHKHIKVYLLVNILLFILNSRLVDFLARDREISDIEFLNWLDWNMLSTPILWGIGLIIHGLYVFKPKLKFVKDWEERQIRKYMNEGDKYR